MLPALLPLFLLNLKTVKDTPDILNYVSFSIKLLFFIYSRNNGYAISTPADEQYRGDGLGISNNFN